MTSTPFIDGWINNILSTRRKASETNKENASKLFVNSYDKIFNEWISHLQKEGLLNAAKRADGKTAYEIALERKSQYLDRCQTIKACVALEESYVNALEQHGEMFDEYKQRVKADHGEKGRYVLYRFLTTLAVGAAIICSALIASCFKYEFVLLHPSDQQKLEVTIDKHLDLKLKELGIHK